MSLLASKFLSFSFLHRLLVLVCLYLIRNPEMYIGLLVCDRGHFSWLLWRPILSSLIVFSSLDVSFQSIRGCLDTYRKRC